MKSHIELLVWLSNSGTKVHQKVISNGLLSEGQRSLFSFLLPKHKIENHPNSSIYNNIQIDLFISIGKGP